MTLSQLMSAQPCFNVAPVELAATVTVSDQEFRPLSLSSVSALLPPTFHREDPVSAMLLFLQNPATCRASLVSSYLSDAKIPEYTTLGLFCSLSFLVSPQDVSNELPPSPGDTVAGFFHSNLSEHFLNYVLPCVPITLSNPSTHFSTLFCSNNDNNLWVYSTLHNKVVKKIIFRKLLEAMRRPRWWPTPSLVYP